MIRWVSGIIPGTPPSVNELALNTRSRAYRVTRDAWMRDMHAVMHESGNVLPRNLARAHAHAILSFPTLRRRDEGNYRSLLEKWLGDVLQANGRLRDDTPEFYRFGSVVFATGGEACTTLVIDYEQGEAVA